MANSENQNQKNDEVTDTGRKSLNQNEISDLFSNNKKRSSKSSERESNKFDLTLDVEKIHSKPYDQDDISSKFGITSPIAANEDSNSKDNNPQNQVKYNTESSNSSVLSQDEILSQIVKKFTEQSSEKHDESIFDYIHDKALVEKKLFDQDEISASFSNSPTSNIESSLDYTHDKNAIDAKLFDQDEIATDFNIAPTSGGESNFDYTLDKILVDEKLFDQDEISASFNIDPISNSVSNQEISVEPNTRLNNEPEVSTSNSPSNIDTKPKIISSSDIAALFEKSKKSSLELPDDDNKTNRKNEEVKKEVPDSNANDEKSNKVLTQTEIFSLFAKTKKEKMQGQSDNVKENKKKGLSIEKPIVRKTTAFQDRSEIQNNELEGIKRFVTQVELDQCYAEIDTHEDFGAIAAEAANIDKMLASAALEQNDLLTKAVNKSIVGIEIGDMSVKFSHISRGNRITFMEAIDIPDGLTLENRERVVLSAMKAIVDKHAIKKERAVICFSEKSTHMRLVKLASLNKPEYQKALAFETRKFISLNEQINPIVNYIPLSEISDAPSEGSRSLVLISDRDVIQRGYSLVKKAGLNVVAIDVVGLAINRFFHQAYKQTQSTDVTVLISMNPKETLLSFSENGHLVWGKYVTVGGADFTDIISDTLMVPKDQAEQLKRKQWQGDAKEQARQSEVHRAMEPVIEHLVGEIRRAIQFYLGQNGDEKIIDRLVLSGASSQINDLNRYLTQSLQIPVVRWNSTEYFDLSKLPQGKSNFEEQLPRYATSLGLCLWNKKKSTVNLIPNYWQRINSKSKSKSNKSTANKHSFTLPNSGIGPLSYIVGVIIIVLLFGVGHLLKTNLADLQTQLDEKKLLLKMQNSTGIRSEMTALRKLRADVSGKRQVIQKLHNNQVNLAHLLGNLSTLIGSKISPIALEYESGKFHFSGYAPSTEALQRMIHKLEAESEYKNLNVGVIRKSDRPGVRRIYFELESELNTKRRMK